jgi:hypothetical protein
MTQGTKYVGLPADVVVMLELVADGVLTMPLALEPVVWMHSLFF